MMLFENECFIIKNGTARGYDKEKQVISLFSALNNSEKEKPIMR